ncbi:hypothetical protein PtA15_18A174 [Puccinia triticina]|uniref:Uncharacterized protein n=1 Tax=Puccinia triticina TaxID=208348 RepID=A0ABY7D9T6_9BASI|nr:uncharacterized protein PtA15_18A174 [Puccinia triticina]WAQ93116.1 hypothetical protein PtA15_18A174 [Puccinia triticina]
MINGLNSTNEASQITTKQNFSSTQTTSALKNSSSAIASGSASAAANAAAGGSSNNQDHTGPEFNPNDICSPHELIGWVDDVLEKLEAKFSRIESDVIERWPLLGGCVEEDKADSGAHKETGRHPLGLVALRVAHMASPTPASVVRTMPVAHHHVFDGFFADVDRTEDQEEGLGEDAQGSQSCLPVKKHPAGVFAAQGIPEPVRTGVEKQGMSGAQSVEDKQIAEAGERETVGLLAAQPEHYAGGQRKGCNEDAELDDEA